ncbi:MAG TPA: hypothetical protein VF263_16015, partial [Longimicrobiaceae bacterium]
MANARVHPGPRRRSPGDPAPTWGDRLRAMRNLPPFLRTVWATHPGYAAGIVALRLVRALIPAATLWVGKAIVDTVAEATRTGVPEWRRLVELVLLELAIVAVGEVAARSGALLESLLADLFSNRMSVR